MIARLAFVLFALLASTKAFTISWDGSPDPTVLGYRVYYGTSSGNYTSTIDAGKATKVIIADPPAGVTYYAVVTAYAAASIESLPSLEVSYTGINTDERRIAFHCLDAALDWKAECKVGRYTWDIPYIVERHWPFENLTTPPTYQRAIQTYHLLVNPTEGWKPFEGKLVFTPEPWSGVGPSRTKRCDTVIPTKDKNGELLSGFMVRLVPISP